MKFPSVVAPFLIFALGYMLVSHPGTACAQLPKPNPLIVPPLPPPPPAQLRPVVPLPGIPSLAVVPTPAAIATPTSAARIFDCSCSGPASPTHWTGRVAAPSYFSARQAAVSACLAYNQNKEPQPPVVVTGRPTVAGASSGGGNLLGAATGLIANQAAVASALSAGQQLPSTVTFFAPQQLRACSRCACD